MAQFSDKIGFFRAFKRRTVMHKLEANIVAEIGFSLKPGKYAQAPAHFLYEH